MFKLKWLGPIFILASLHSQAAQLDLKKFGLDRFKSEIDEVRTSSPTETCGPNDVCALILIQYENFNLPPYSITRGVDGTLSRLAQLAMIQVQGLPWLTVADDVFPNIFPYQLTLFRRAATTLEEGLYLPPLMDFDGSSAAVTDGSLDLEVSIKSQGMNTANAVREGRVGTVHLPRLPSEHAISARGLRKKIPSYVIAYLSPVKLDPDVNLTIEQRGDRSLHTADFSFADGADGLNFPLVPLTMDTGKNDSVVYNIRIESLRRAFAPFRSFDAIAE